MEKLNKSTNETKEKVEIKDVTKEIIDRVGKSYQVAIKKITQEGRIYTVELNDGYTCFNQKSRKARRVPEIGFIARVAAEQKDNKKPDEEYLKEFKANGIWFEGNKIPEYIDTVEDVKAREEKAKEVKETKPTKEVKEVKTKDTKQAK